MTYQRSIKAAASYDKHAYHSKHQWAASAGMKGSKKKRHNIGRNNGIIGM